MSTITIIGSGNVGSAVAAVVAKGGASVQVLGRDLDKAAALASQVGGTSGSVGDAITGDIVVLTVPYAALSELADLYGSQLDGKAVVDVTNPLDFSTFDSLTVAAGSSAADELQAKLPNAKVLKAFNTVFAGALAAGKAGDAPVTVLVAGDDATAKQALIDAVTAGGVAAVDAGSLKRAHELEALGFLQLTLAAGETIGWTGGFTLNK
ncbi:MULTISPECIES: NADPH-dependent F420 reductase [Aestuariimicrobium]|uniref:NADPH-dependent F420 reductase n=1 Tax=Aestuariimicrobium TaxID=396388 RepID=UPI0003B64706|nr:MULTISPECIES: NAD(P)-binding domain-containing protein [Aestuariimicrobium]CAI9403146.1 hypothetical protein AESSP_00946 [Aestuariimicrobium sp. T2.26MG-19.2B]